MDFSLFIHMERWDDEITHQQAWENLVELTLMAEAGGFRTVWIGEHHSMEYTISPNPMSQLAYLAGKTEKIRLGAGTIIAPFWNPLRAAGEGPLLDVISGGRAEMGVARGAYQFEFDRMADGLPATDGGQHLRELVPAMKKLWEGDYAHEGKIWKFPVSTSVPKPVQTPGPPVWVAARDINSHEFAVENGCNVMVTPLMKDDDEVVDLLSKFNSAVDKFKPADKPKIMVLRHTFVHDENAPDHWKVGAAGVNKFYRTFDAWFGNKTDPVNGFLEPSPESKFADRPEFSLDSLRRSAMIGTPSEVIERVRQYKEWGVDEYSFWCDNSLSHEEKKQSLKLFIDEVVPAINK
ncbi:LLM class flavin-dependent oxidoreductase [Micrococcoides hystricis]|uniref:LLM class flavin-dependent oxidoreductase n=1 Tax=Micrococcoides hystricis TaxID=1572761 RepID=A0ABV6PA51_9MICC